MRRLQLAAAFRGWQEKSDEYRPLRAMRRASADPMSEISRAVGGSKATIYGYFASKEELFVAAADLEGGSMLEAC